MITLLIVAAIWINAYLENLCHMDRSTGTTHAFSKRLNIYRNFESFQYSLEFSKLQWKDASTSEFIAHRIPAANILTTNRAIPLFCRLLWTQILNL